MDVGEDFVELGQQLYDSSVDDQKFYLYNRMYSEIG